MKNKICRILPLALAAICLAGCNPDNQPVPDGATNTQGTNSAMNSLSQSRDEFLAASRQKMQDLDAQIKSLSDKYPTLQDDAKAKADKAMAELRAQRQKLGEEYDALKQSSQETWDKTKAAFSAGWNDVENAYHDARAKFDQTP